MDESYHWEYLNFHALGEMSSKIDRASLTFFVQMLALVVCENLNTDFKC